MVSLGQIAAVKLGKMLDRSKHKSGRKLSYLRNINVRWGSIDTSDLLEMFFKDAAEEEKYLVRPGDVLVCEGGEPGRASVWSGGETELKYQKALHRVRFHEPYEPKLLVYFLQWMASTGRLEEFFTGSTIKHFTRQSFIGLRVPNPPLPEQRRIVARIEELFSRLDAGVAALHHAKAQLQRYRQAVLTAAVTGQLTQAWREQHPDTEPADELLKRILKQRRERWDGKGKYSEPEGPDVARMPEIPNSWKWARLDALCAIGFGMSVSKNRRHKNPVKVSYLRVANVQRGRLVLDEVKSMEIESDRLAHLSLKVGDVLFNEGGDRDKLGRGWVWDGQIDPCITQNHVFRASPFDLEALLPKFLSHWGNTFGQRFFLDEGTQTTNLASISKGVLSSFPVPLPPLAEQHQIVAEVEARTAAIDHFEAELDRQITHSSWLQRSTLAAAFSGRLI